MHRTVIKKANIKQK